MNCPTCNQIITDENAVMHHNCLPAPTEAPRETISIKDAFGITLTLFKECQAERDTLTKRLEAAEVIVNAVVRGRVRNPDYCWLPISDSELKELAREYLEKYQPETSANGPEDG